MYIDQKASLWNFHHECDIHGGSRENLPQDPWDLTQHLSQGYALNLAAPRQLLSTALSRDTVAWQILSNADSSIGKCARTPLSLANCTTVKGSSYQCSYFFPLLSQVWDLHCRLKSLPTVYYSYSPLSHRDISPNKSILPLTLSWHLLPRGLDCLKGSSPFYNENVMALCLSCYQGIRKAQSIIGNLLSVAIKCGCLFLWTLSCNSSEVFSSLEFTEHFLPSSPTLTWLGSIHSSGSGTDQYLSFQEAFSDLTLPKALVNVSEELYISLLYQLHYITWKLHGYLPH